MILPRNSPDHVVLRGQVRRLKLRLSSFTRIRIISSLDRIQACLLRKRCLDIISGFRLRLRHRTKLVHRIPLRRFTLNDPLFLLVTGHLDHTLRTTRTSPQSNLTAMRRFITLLRAQQANQPRISRGSLTSRPPSPPPTEIPRFRTPGFLIHTASPNGASAVHLAVNARGHAVRAVATKLVVRQLNLLRRFLPHDKHCDNAHCRVH